MVRQEPSLPYSLTSPGTRAASVVIEAFCGDFGLLVGPGSLMWDIPVNFELLPTYTTGWVRYTSTPDAMAAPGFHYVRSNQRRKHGFLRLHA
ncbi:hypothetical protein PoMZ_01201 [Pyricularia oryzae]|uniref:Uncharacterized protein n=1 Tax=Pyricularia oryzae TaxID=318829 RepID=A0A4V1C5G4_PYROR|nr:hypothetical protein PoMZ_01201 [Pyricularia oryzae]